MADTCGYIAVSRSVWEHPVFPDEAMSKREAWLWIVNAAAWRQTRIKSANGPISLDRGQLSYSLRFMAKKFQWSTNKVRRFLECLQNEHMLALETDTAANTAQLVITICNYNRYQDGKTQANTAIDTPTDTQVDTPTDTKKKKITNNQSNSLRSLDNDQFDIWWNDYNLKVAKPQAKKAFIKALKKTDFQTLCDKARVYESQITDKQFQKHPATWLNSEGWNDDLVAKPPPRGSPQAKTSTSTKDALNRILGNANDDLSRNQDQIKIIEH